MNNEIAKATHFKLSHVTTYKIDIFFQIKIEYIEYETEHFRPLSLEMNNIFRDIIRIYQSL